MQRDYHSVPGYVEEVGPASRCLGDEESKHHPLGVDPEKLLGQTGSASEQLLYSPSTDEKTGLIQQPLGICRIIAMNFFAFPYSLILSTMGLLTLPVEVHISLVGYKRVIL